MGELFNGPAFIAAQAAIFCRGTSPLPHSSPSTASQASERPLQPSHHRQAPKKYLHVLRAAAEEDRHMRDPLNIVAGIGMSDIGRPSGKVGNWAMQVGQLMLAHLDLAAAAGPVVHAAVENHRGRDAGVGGNFDGLQATATVTGNGDAFGVDVSV